MGVGLLSGVADTGAIFSYKSDFLQLFQTDCDFTNLLSIGLFDLDYCNSGTSLVGKIPIIP